MTGQVAEPLLNPYLQMLVYPHSAVHYMVPENLTDHSIKGWTNKETWIRYIKVLRYQFIKPLPPPNDFFDETNSIYLFIDSYRVHFCAEIIGIATELNIPEGMTDIHQPIDNKILSELSKPSLGHS